MFLQDQVSSHYIFYNKYLSLRIFSFSNLLFNKFFLVHKKMPIPKNIFSFYFKQKKYIQLFYFKFYNHQVLKILKKNYVIKGVG